MTTRPGMFLLSSCALALVACNLTPGSSTDDSGDAGGPTIADIQNGVFAEDENVRLDGVIVTSPITLDGEGFFIQDAGGGEWSGVYVYLAGGAEGLYLDVGDVITVTGAVTEFYELTELVVASPTAIEVTGQEEVTTEVVDPNDVPDWEVWEGALITVEEVSVVGCMDFGEAPLTDELSIDDRILEYESEPGATYTSVTGLISYSYSAWKIYPRTADDLVGYAAGDGGSVVSVQDVQTGAGGECGLTLEDVVVTSPATSSGNGFYVSDAVSTAAAYTGVYVYAGSAGVPADVVQGATLTMVGSAIEYDGDEDGFPITEFMPDSITVTGTGSVPAPLALQATPSDWAPYDGVLVTLEAVEVTDADAGYGEAETDWGINIDDWFVEFSSSTGTQYDVTGIINQFYGWKIAPRAQDDLAAH